MARSMKRLTTILAILTLPVILLGQVNSRIKVKGRTVNQLEAYGRVNYLGIDYYPVGKDSLIVKGEWTERDTVIIPENLTIDNHNYSVTGLKPSAFEYNADTKFVSLPSSVDTIASSAFYSCHNLSECKMPGATIIKGYAFFRTGFKELRLPSGIKRIGKGAFSECDNLKYLELPSSLEHIDDIAFLGCRLDTVKVNFNHPIELGSSVFIRVRRNAPYRKICLSVPTGSKAAFEADDKWRLFSPIIEH